MRERVRVRGCVCLGKDQETWLNLLYHETKDSERMTLSLVLSVLSIIRKFSEYEIINNLAKRHTIGPKQSLMIFKIIENEIKQLGHKSTKLK